MKYFYKLRSQILKQGSAGTAMYAHIREFHFPQDMTKLGPPPPNTRGFFIGDSTGGSGWEVEVAPGTIEKFYVTLPADLGITGLYFRDAPGANQAEAPDLDAVVLCSKYLKRMEAILEDAEALFKKS